MPIFRSFKPGRSLIAALSAGLIALTCMPAAAQGDATQYPSRPVRLVVSYGAGGSLDAIARLLGQELQKQMGQSFVVENVAGAGGTIGVRQVINAAPDGYTLLMGITSDVALAPLTNLNAKYQSTDLTPVANIGTSGIVLVSRPDLPVNNLTELLQLAKTKPGQIRYGTSGTGSLPHVAMENVNNIAGVDIPLIPYKSASNITSDLLGGHVDLAIVGLPALLPMIQQQKLKALAVFSKKRDIGDRSIPSASETVGLQSVDFAFWTGMFAPKGTPPAIVNKVRDAVVAILRRPDMVKQFSKMGVEVAQPQTAEEFKSYVEQSQRQLQDAVKRARISAQ
ncbi:tripartite tricarboxylate transporter substrate binding protein [uncultured Variovorax sp.]|uniref:Bug family tripartite tricarboxylate transporter substrate binding protein n=1 Tax=uncultured Variovorax sp. TaxID=114708 RepID=UPI0025EC7B16|nr:tripartite tricarboxylate transporter substrate binding protein [uncultured Variovorax sp.]